MVNCIKYDNRNFLFKYNGRYVYVHDDSDRLNLIYKLPNYLKEEWIKRNIFDVDIKLLESLQKKEKIENQILKELIRDFKLSILLNQ